MTNFEKFMEAYARHLLAVVSDPANLYPANPEGYSYGPPEVPSKVLAMGASFKRGDFNKDGLAIKRTCKELKLKHTYREINAFIKDGV